eukprot:gene1413-4579_t
MEVENHSSHQDFRHRPPQSDRGLNKRDESSQQVEDEFLKSDQSSKTNYMAELYTTASDILLKLRKHRGTVKTLCLEAPYKHKKKLYALICQTLKHQAAINAILKQVPFFEQEENISVELAQLLCHDLLFGGGLRCGGYLRYTVTKYESKLEDALSQVMINRGCRTKQDLEERCLSDAFPKYVRINTLRGTWSGILTGLERLGYELLSKESSTISHILSSKLAFYQDSHVKNLLAFHPRTDFHNSGLYKNGQLILQDKASCFPAIVLHPPPGAICIDACAAPGNKTSHLAAIMHNKGKIFAFDISKHRMQVLRRQLSRAGVTCVKTMQNSFLDADPTDVKYSAVRYILCDPSCSGSGIVSRMSHLVDDTSPGAKEQGRLESLSQFQVQIVLHALSFPNVQKVAYSTCSIHKEENEDVVATILEQNPLFELADALPKWPRRGISSVSLPKALASKCIRTVPEEDGTNGFFVALFVRKQKRQSPKQQNDALPKKRPKRARGRSLRRPVTA